MLCQRYPIEESTKDELADFKWLLAGYTMIFT